MDGTVNTRSSNPSSSWIRSISALAALVVALPAPAGARQPQARQPTFPVATEIVTVDVVVIGRDGRPVVDLRREDFTLSEDGVPQEIVSFEAVNRPAPSAPPASATPPEPRTASNQAPAGREPASFVVVFDELHLSPAEAVRARQAVARFLAAGVANGDRVSLVGTAQGTRATARIPDGREGLAAFLERLQGRQQSESVRSYMTDYEAMRIDQDRDPIVTDEVMRRLLANGEIRRDVSLPRQPVDEGEELPGWRDQTRALAAPTWGRARQRLAQTLGIVERSLAALGEAPGRKSLVLVSAGLVHDARLATFRSVVTDSLRANAPIYSLDARGLVAAGSGMQADVTQPLDIRDRATGAGLNEAKEASEGSDSLALDTGGFVIRNRNDLAPGLEAIGRESRSHYLLGYTPANRAADGRFRKIAVALARDGLQLRARRGYYAPGPGAARARAEGRDAAIQRALDAPFDLAGLPLRGLAFVFGAADAGRTQVIVTVEADIRGLAFTEKGGSHRDTLEYLLLVAQRATGEEARIDQQFALDLKPETRARYEREWFAISRELPLVPGPYQAKVVVRDANGGRLGSLTHDFDVPPSSGLRISSLVVSDRSREDASSHQRVPELQARRTFAAAGVLHCRFEVYGAAKDRATGRPSLLAGFALRRGDGRVLAALPETAVQPAADGSLARSLGVPLDGAPPGRYEAIVIVTDAVAGTTAEMREPLVIEAPDPAPR